jgi:hypothetical protein
MAQMQTIWASMDAANEAIIPSVLAQLQQTGLIPSITTTIQSNNAFAASLAPPVPTRPISVVGSLGPGYTIPNGAEAFGGTKCAAAGMTVCAAGLAFMVIGIMSAGTVPVLMGAAWAGIALWGGGVATGAGVVAALGCNF